MKNFEGIRNVFICFRKKDYVFLEILLIDIRRKIILYVILKKIF